MNLDYYGLGIFLLAIVVASVGLFTYFSLDDYIYLHRAEDHTSSLGQVFAPFYTFSPWLSYRPLPTMFWVVLFGIFGPAPLPLSIGVILLFSGMVFYIYRIGTLLGGRMAGLISGALVALYFPIYSVAWSRWSSSLQMELLFLASSAFYLARWAKHQLGEGNKAGLPTLGIVLMVGAFLSKETSFMLPMLLPLLVPKKRVFKLAASLFTSGVAIFVISRALIPSKFPLPKPRFDISVILRNLEFFTREQFLFYLPATLILVAALAWGKKNRHIFLLAAMGLFLGMNAILGHSPATHRIKLAVCSLAVIYCVIKASARVRFALGWAALLLLPPLLVLDTTVHQSAESFLGLALFIGMGVSRQLRLAYRLSKRWFRGFTVAGVAAQFAGNSLRILRIAGAIACIPFLLYAAFTVLKLNVRVAIPEATKMVQASRLTRDVREYLCAGFPAPATIHSTNLPGLISVPDIPFDARLHGCNLIVDEDLSAREGVFVITSDTPKEIVDEVGSKGQLMRRIVRTPYEVTVFSSAR
ncbi:MAG: hypothetical protein JW941_11880 [Candidatus Coatesbacteria bacterium]|nr:hypothetical protein [Candidatus Coatesbacteria bacterium]